jgi:NAD(P)-dependent dehydrogenase (short-subunit alcohol dehydrogenase family)
MVDGKIALVTGAARGIGFEIAQTLAEAGARVALVDINVQQLEQSKYVLAGKGLTVMHIGADVSDPEQVNAAILAVNDHWGQLDILVNNAGICPLTPLAEITAQEWDRIMSVNLKGAFLFSQAASVNMLQQKSGKIINMASSAGQMGGLAVGVHYSTSKAGMLGLTKSLARILAPHIQVNAISPGTTESEMTRTWNEADKQAIIRQIPAGRLGRPGDVAAAVLFLASAASDFITGQTLNVNGGLFIS